jgi:hypothetical protein
LSGAKEDVTVQIRYKHLEENFCGKPEEVWLLTEKFFNQFLPSFDLANKIVLNVDLQRLIKECEGIIGFAPEGSLLLVPRDRLTDNETLGLVLLAGYVSCRLGITETEGIPKEELRSRLGKDAKIVSTRLGELAKSEMAAKTVDEKYRITTFGLLQMQKEVLPRIRAKMGS